MDFDLERGRRLYDWWGRHPRLYRGMTEVVCLGRRRRLRRRAVDALELRRGETVLDLACGHGVNFPLLEEAIGPSGRLVALDYSKEMLTAARERVRHEGWRNVELLQRDAARMKLPPRSLDAAICTLGLSAIPDHRAAIAAVVATLRAGGRFVVLDARTFRGPARVLNPVITPLFEYATNWDAEADLSAELNDASAEVAVENFNGGSMFIAVARKSAAGSEGTAQ